MGNMYKDLGPKHKRIEVQSRKSHNLKFDIDKAYRKTNIKTQRNPIPTRVYKKNKKWDVESHRHQNL